MQRFLFLFVSVFSTLIPSFRHRKWIPADIQRQLVDMKPRCHANFTCRCYSRIVNRTGWGESAWGRGINRPLSDAVGEPEGILVAPLQRKPDKLLAPQ